MPTPIDPKRIRTDLDTQSRVALNEDVVKEYAEAMEAGAEFPAPIVFYDEPPKLILPGGTSPVERCREYLRKTGSFTSTHCSCKPMSLTSC